MVVWKIVNRYRACHTIRVNWVIDKLNMALGFMLNVIFVAVLLAILHARKSSVVYQAFQNTTQVYLVTVLHIMFPFVGATVIHIHRSVYQNVPVCKSQILSFDLAEITIHVEMPNAPAIRSVLKIDKFVCRLCIDRAVNINAVS